MSTAKSAAGVPMQGQVQSVSSRFDRVEVQLELPMQVAWDAYFVFRESSKRCSDYMADALYRGIRDANHERSDLVEVEVRYNDRAWKTWLLKICKERPWFVNGEAEQNLNGLATLLEGL